jgi:hypothetical protein
VCAPRPTVAVELGAKFIAIRRLRHWKPRLGPIATKLDPLKPSFADDER